MAERNFEYDIALSFAGEQRPYVLQVAQGLRSQGVRVFYDDYETDNLWGKDLYAHLTEVYQHKCRYCVVFVSKEYADKVWPTAEFQSAQARAIMEKGEYILPARFDNTSIPGLLHTVGYIDLSSISPEQLTRSIIRKLGKEPRHNYLPPDLDRLYSRLNITDNEDAQSFAYSRASSFFRALCRMTPDERKTATSLIQFACPADLPDELHIDADLLSRVTEQSITRLRGI